MRADVIRLYKSVHTWTGIVSGLLLFIAFYAGALTMFALPLSRWANPPADKTLASAPAPLDQAEALIAATLAARPDAGKQFTLHLDRDQDQAGAAPLTWQAGRADRAPWAAALAPDGALRVTRLQPSGLARFIDQLHRTAGLPGDPEVTEWIVGAVSLLYAVALVSGLIIVLPSLIKDLFALRLGRNVKRMWLDAHNAIGIASLPFHIVIALTAVVFCLHDPFYDAQDKLVYDGALKAMFKASNPYGAVKPDPRPAAMLAPPVLLARVKAFAPQFDVVSLQYRAAGTAGALVRVSGHDARFMVRGEGFLVMSPVTGAIVNTEYFPGAQGAWSAPVSAIFSLHFGSFGGEPVRWAYFLLGLAGAFLFYSGNLLWIETRRKTTRNGAAPVLGAPVLQRRAARALAAATVGVCVGAVSGTALTIAAAKGLYGHVADLDGWHQGIYYAVFVSCVIWACWRGAARAGVELLWWAVLCMLAIPAASLLMGLGGTGWTHAYGIDIAALVGASCLASMARGAARRAGSAIVDSVWSARLKS